MLDIDPGLSTNRTIYSKIINLWTIVRNVDLCFIQAFVGHPQAVIEAAMAAARTAYNLIDMTRHCGEHPRIGAMVIEKISNEFVESVFLRM